MHTYIILSSLYIHLVKKHVVLCPPPGQHFFLVKGHFFSDRGPISPCSSCCKRTMSSKAARTDTISLKHVYFLQKLCMDIRIGTQTDLVKPPPLHSLHHGRLTFPPNGTVDTLTVDSGRSVKGKHLPFKSGSASCSKFAIKSKN